MNKKVIVPHVFFFFLYNLSEIFVGKKKHTQTNKETKIDFIFRIRIKLDLRIKRERESFVLSFS